jgi:hypothetical protein
MRRLVGGAATNSEDYDPASCRSIPLPRTHKKFGDPRSQGSLQELVSGHPLVLAEPIVDDAGFYGCIYTDDTQQHPRLSCVFHVRIPTLELFCVLGDGRNQLDSRQLQSDQKGLLSQGDLAYR